AAATHPDAKLGVAVETFEITVSNAGPNALTDLSISVSATGFTNPQWTCEVAIGSLREPCQPASGSGDPATLVDLPISAVARLLLSGAVDIGENFFVIDAVATPPEGVVVNNTDDDHAHYVAPSSPAGIFLGDFE